MNTDTRSELRASSPASRPSSPPRRGRGASASSPATDAFNPNLDEWEGKVSTLLHVFVVVYLRIVQTKDATNRKPSIQQQKVKIQLGLLHESTCTRDGASSCCGRGGAQP